MSYTETAIDFLHHHLDRIPSKRKLDDFEPEEDDSPDLLFARTKKDEMGLINSSAKSSDGTSSEHGITRVSYTQSVSCSGSSSRGPKTIHFFVRMISGGNTLVIHANSDDSVESVHQQIRRMTGIPIIEQRLIYRGRQLQWEQSLDECSIQNDAGLQLVGRMRSTEYPATWQLVNDLISYICRLCRNESPPSDIVESRVEEFLKITLGSRCDMSAGHLQIFKSAGVPSALVMLFLSPITGNKECAEEAIRHFLNPSVFLVKPINIMFVPIILEFCKLLSRTANDSPLNFSCRSTLMYLFETMETAHESKYFGYGDMSIMVRELFPFVCEIACRLSMGLEATVEPTMSVRKTSSGDVHEFSVFLAPLLRAMEDQLGCRAQMPVCLHDRHFCYGVDIGTLHVIFLELLEKIDGCFKTVEEIWVAKNPGEIDRNRLWWCSHLAILKQLYSISKFYNAEEKLLSVLRSRRVSLNVIIKYAAKRSNDHSWLLEHKDLTDFESRRHLVMMLLPEVKDDYEELHEMLIDRSQLLTESFNYITRAAPESLHGGIFMEFKDEEATGPGVLREWFCLVCQAIFNRQHALFLACPNDHRRFFPSAASDVDPLHLAYFQFCGRVIALALMHKVHVGIVFDRIFFLQLAGKYVSLEDTRDAEPCLYMSCKRILEMDADFLDSDALGLTFVIEVEELGSRRTVELCPGGKSIVLNSSNREEYVNLLIQHHFVTSISKQVAYFAIGFTDVLCSSTSRFFFQSLELEDLDHMLHGSDKAICVKDWKAHTDYNGYRETDNEIHWFWKVVEDMSQEQLRVLLFFWTSVKYLPVEGFDGLQSRLYIFKASESHARLPSSHTCFYRLCLPAYPSETMMRDTLQIITQEHFSCSFGIW